MMESLLAAQPGTDATFTVHLDSGAGLPKPKRRKTTAACELCRVRKSRCDGNRPKCGPCLQRRNYSVPCVYPDRKAHRQSQREALRVVGGPLLSDKSTSIPSLSGDCLAQLSSATTHGAPTGESPSTGEKRTPAQLHFSEDPSKENDAMGNVDNWGLTAGLYGASSSVTFMHSICNLVERKNLDKYPSVPPTTPPLRRDLYRSRLPTSTSTSLEYVLPPRRTADRLLDIHWKTSHIIFPWIDRLHFIEWYESLWKSEQHVDSRYDEQAHHCILNIIFALAYKTDPQISGSEQESQSDAHFTRAQKLLFWNLLDISHIELMQALLLMSQYLQSTNMPRAFFECIGLAIWVGKNMGFHIPGRVSSFQNEHECEMAKRVWHGCIMMDRIASMTLGRATRISQDTARQTSLPAVVDDEYLSRSGFEKGVQPTEVPSKMGFFAAYCDLHLIMGDILSTIYAPRSPSGQPSPIIHIQSIATTGKQSIDQLLRFERSLALWESQLPIHLKLEGNAYVFPEDDIFQRQAIGLRLRFLHIRMLLYRPFFSEPSEKSASSSSDGVRPQVSPVTESISAQGLVACVTAAQDLLELISNRLLGGPQLLPPWWHVISYVYTSATIVLAAHAFPVIMNDVSAHAIAGSVQQGFNILQQFGTERLSARRCRAALEVLYNKIVSPTKDDSSQTDAYLHRDSGKSDFTAEFQLPADFGYDSAPFELFDGNELLWLNSAPFDPANNFWL